MLWTEILFLSVNISKIFLFIYILKVNSKKKLFIDSYLKTAFSEIDY